MLNVILMNQRAYRDKTGLGYKHKDKKWVEPKVKPYLKFSTKPLVTAPHPLASATIATGRDTPRPPTMQRSMELIAPISGFQKEPG